jgi:hypothetical protein
MNASTAARRVAAVGSMAWAAALLVALCRCAGGIRGLVVALRHYSSS